MRMLDAETAARLELVRVPPGPVDVSDFPTFLLVGPQRTGTTWLFSHLQRHPEIWGPPKKEIYYFNNLPSASHHPAFLPPVAPELEWYLDHFRPTAREIAARDAQCRADYGVGFERKAWGEATATYAVAFHQQPRRFRDLLLLKPDVKIVIMVRDPVERAWSHAKTHFLHHMKRRFRDVAEDEWIEFVNRPYQVLCGLFSHFVPTWQQHVAPENLLVARFADVRDRPREVLRRVLAFLGVRHDDAVLLPPDSGQQNAAPEIDAPQRIRTLLEERYAEERGILERHGLL